MPVEIVVISPVAPNLALLVIAGARVEPDLGLRTLSGGAVHQLCRTVDGDDVAVLSLQQPTLVENRAELTRLLPAGSVPPHLAAADDVWWCEALAPWGADGRRGVRVARAFAEQLGGVCVVQDGG